MTVTRPRNRVVPAGMKGLAFQESPGAEINPFKRAMFFNRFVGVHGAGGVKAAVVPQERRYAFLIRFDQQE